LEVHEGADCHTTGLLSAATEEVEGTNAGDGDAREGSYNGSSDYA
jgi:hypothetical protein